MTVTMVWVQDRGWYVGGEHYTCRHPRCRNDAVAWMWRKHGRGYQRWHYCAEHMDGRRIEGDAVIVEVAADSPAAERGFVT